MTAARASAPTIICGGGVIGAAIAFELASRGEPAVIVEPDGIASGASGAAAGILTPPLPGDADPLAEMRRVSFDLHAALAPVLATETGVDYGYGRTPRALLASTRAEAGELRAAGEWYDAATLANASGWIDRGAVGGLITEPPAQVDPYRLTLTFVTAAERRGARVVAARVVGLGVRKGRVASVELEGGRAIDASRAVIAMGPWLGDASEWLGLPVPVEPLKGQIVKVRPRAPLSPFGFTVGGNYAITKPGGLVYLGTTEERAGFDRSTTTEAQDEILAFGLRFASALEDAEFVEQTACLRPLSADGLPIIGAVPGIEYAYLATGHGRQGILMAPATARALTELIMDGAATTVNLAPFAPARFAIRGP